MRKLKVLRLIKATALVTVSALTAVSLSSCIKDQGTAANSSSNDSADPATSGDATNVSSALTEGKYTDGTLVYYVSGENASVVDYIGTEKVVEIPAKIDGLLVTSIGADAFADVSTIEKIVVPPSVTYIGDFAFSFCTGLKEIEIPETVTSMGSYVFNHCTSLESCVLPNGMSTINQSLFYYCTSLKSVTLPQYINGIPKETFFMCESLTDFEIPKYVARPIPILSTVASRLKSLNCRKTSTMLEKPRSEDARVLPRLIFLRAILLTSTARLLPIALRLKR